MGAEGFFSVRDPATCTVQVEWQAWAQKVNRVHKEDGYDQDEDATVTETGWQPMARSPMSIVPNEAGKTDIAKVAEQFMGATDPADPMRAYHKRKEFSRIDMPDYTAETARAAGMDPDNIAYINPA